MVQLERSVTLMTWDQFSSLDPDCKHREVTRLLPLVSLMGEDVASLQRDVAAVEARLQEIRCRGCDGGASCAGYCLDTTRRTAAQRITSSRRVCP